MADQIGIEISGLCSFLFWPYPLTSNDPAKRARGLELAGLIAKAVGGEAITVERILGLVFAPLAWAMGVPWRDAPTIGNLLGTRMVLNEFVAYSQLGPLDRSPKPVVAAINGPAVGIVVAGRPVARGHRVRPPR